MRQIRSPIRTGLADYLRSHPHPGGIIVSQRHRFIYMKPCRTGGTSILRKTLEQMPLDTFHFKDHRQRFTRWLRTINDEALNDYRIFSFVRNPWDRAVSIARYFNIPLGDFVADHQRLVRDDQNLRQHSLPCYKYTHLGEHPFVDLLGRFEQIDSDFQDICGQIGIASPNRLPHANASNRTHYSQYFDDRSRAVVRKIYKRDIEFFDYRF